MVSRLTPPVPGWVLLVAPCVQVFHVGLGAALPAYRIKDLDAHRKRGLELDEQLELFLMPARAVVWTLRETARRLRRRAG